MTDPDVLVNLLTAKELHLLIAINFAQSSAVATSSGQIFCLHQKAFSHGLGPMKSARRAITMGALPTERPGAPAP